MREYSLIRSKRKTLAVEITKDCKVLVRAPMKISIKKIEAFLVEYDLWIEKHLEKQRKRTEQSPPLNEEQINQLKAFAKEYIPAKVFQYARLMGVEYSGVKITSAKTRYGSCSSKNSLCFSYILMQKPLFAVDYVIVHELAHTVHRNHGKDFYMLIEKYMPDYKARINALKGSVEENTNECI